jgi:hypothetical protein
MLPGHINVIRALSLEVLPSPEVAKAIAAG